MNSTHLDRADAATRVDPRGDRITDTSMAAAVSLLAAELSAVTVDGCGDDRCVSCHSEFDLAA